MTTVTIHQAKTHLSRLLMQVKTGAEVLICKGSQPVAKIVPYQEKKEKRPPVGVITSAPVVYDEDCFDPLTDEQMEQWGLV